MRLQQYINEDKDKEIKQRWNLYIKSNPMIKNGVGVLNKISSKGYDAYIVGGAVRDLIMGQPVKDVDIATNMPIDELEKTFKKVYDIGKSKDFGIVVVNQGGYQFEISQFRAESDYSDGRHPDKIQIVTDFRTDASRRDLTINAMAIDKDGNIVDHFDGKKAIFDKIIKTVGNPNDRFKEDKLRMMRACRFSSKYCFTIDPETKKAIKNNKEGINDIAMERVKDELIKMASNSGDKFANAILTLDEVGILDIILPELTKLKDFKETLKWHPEAYKEGNGSPFDHTMAALRRNKIADPIVNLAILFHDIGKGVTHRLRSDGIRHSYFQHDKKGAEIIKDIAKRLKLTNKERDAIMFSAINHMKLFKGGDMKPNKILKLVNDENWEVLKQVSYCDDSCRIGLFDKKTFDDTISNMEKIAKKWGDKLSKKKIKIIDGNRIMRLTGLKPGKDVGMLIKKVTDYIITHNIKNQKDIDDAIINIYKEQK